MKFVKTTLAIIFSAFLFASCTENTSDVNPEEVSVSETISIEELSTAIESVKINYAITAVNDDDTTEEITSDEELEAYNNKNNKPKIEFPFDVTIDGEIVTINNVQEFKALVKSKKGKKPPFTLVYPLTVINADETTTEIADKEALKTYKEGLEEDTKVTFQFPISITDEEGTIVEIADQESFDTYISEQKKDKKIKDSKLSYTLVYPLTVINADETTTEIADKEALKAYKESLEEDTKVTFQFPISITDEEETIIEIADEETLKTYITSNKSKKKKKGNSKPKGKK